MHDSRVIETGAGECEIECRGDVIGAQLAEVQSDDRFGPVGNFPFIRILPKARNHFGAFVESPS